MTAEKGRLENKVAIVTGGANGIGRAYVEALAAEGARVLAADLDGDALEHLAKDTATSSAEIATAIVDVTDDAAVSRMVDQAVSTWGRVDIVVNNAAMFRRVAMTVRPFDEIDISELEQMLQINVIGVWRVCAAIAPVMRPQGYGKIINVSSTLAFHLPAGRGPYTHYAVSKAALLGLTRGLARELGPAGIRVNCVAPGAILTDLDESRDVDGDPQIHERALGQLARPADLLGTIVFLASEESDFITGQTLVVDGGAVMR